MERTPEDLAYIAGIVDGEGSISLHRYRYTPKAKFESILPRVDITMVDKEAISLISSIFDGSRGKKSG